MAPGSLKRLSSTDRDISPPAKRKVAATTTNKAVTNFFKPTSQKEPEKTTFQILHDSLLIARYENAHTAERKRPAKIAGFDFDSTLISSASGLRFARDAHDWKWWDATVPAKLRLLSNEGYTVVILSNQAGISLRPNPKSANSDMKRLADFKSKISAVLSQLDLPITVYAATGHDLFRKPRTGMWEQMLKDYGLTTETDVDLSECQFVGDAAGRAGDKAKGVPKDHSCSDRDFATNIGIRFHTPEEFFLGEAPQPFVRSFDPATYLETENAAEIDAAPVVFNEPNEVEIVLFCGSPGAGKSTFFWTHLKPLGYERVNQDILKTRDKCMKAASQYIEEGKPVVVDNTNADIETREAWIKLASRFNVAVRCVLFTASPKVCEHNDTVRALAGPTMNPESRTLLPKMAFSGFASRYREPKTEEGFQDITKVNFKFHGDEQQRALWRRYWVS